MRPEDDLVPERVRARVAAALGAAAAHPLAARARAAVAVLRRRPDAVMAVVLFAGVLAMVLHWR